MQHQRHEEQRDEERVGGERGPVLVHARERGAVGGPRRQGAVLVGAVADEVGGGVVGVGHCFLFVWSLVFTDFSVFLGRFGLGGENWSGGDSAVCGNGARSLFLSFFLSFPFIIEANNAAKQNAQSKMNQTAASMSLYIPSSSSSSPKRTHASASFFSFS